MTEKPSLRAEILQELTAKLTGTDSVIAFWEQGSTATGRADQWSDLDLIVLVADGQVEPVKDQVEQTLSEIRAIEIRYEVPQPSWHGHWQAFYRLVESSPFFMVDLVIIEESHPNRFLEPELHGMPAVYIDKKGITAQSPTPASGLAARLAGRLPLLEVTMELFHPFVDKELMRDRPVDAMHFYHNIVVLRLVEALRIRHCPWRFNFGLRYLGYDLPDHVYGQVRELCYVADPAELTGKKSRAVALFRETLAELKSLDLAALIEQSRD